MEFIASTEAIDAHRSIVRQSWNLERYRQNPVVLYAHDPDDERDRARMAWIVRVMRDIRAAGLAIVEADDGR